MLNDSKDDEVVSRGGGVDHYTSETITQGETMRTGDIGGRNGNKDLKLRLSSEEHVEMTT